MFLCAVALSPAVAHAGFFSFISTIFAKEAPVEEKSLNSQTMPLLQAAVNTDPNPAKGGGDITIVGGTALLSENGPSGTIADIEEKNQSDRISVYVVHEGDTLSEIAKTFGVTVSTIVWANDIKRGLITPGEKLIILPISGVKHNIVKGDTLASVAKKYKADVVEIIQYNNLTEGVPLAIGTTLIIPDGEVAVTSVSGVARGTGGPRYDGYYLRPILGGRKTQGLHGYNGVDLGTDYGAPVFTSAAGQVIISRNYGWNGGYGNYLVVRHANGTQTLYAHLSGNVVFEGYQVYQGQVVGYVGNTGKSTGAHLHFEVRGAANPF